MPTLLKTSRTDTAAPSGPVISRAKLDMLTISRKEGWKRTVQAPRRTQPAVLTSAELSALSDAERAAEAKARRIWHANLGPLKTPQLTALHEDMWDIYDSNEEDGDAVKSAMAIDAYPGLGKTTAALAFARALHRREVAENGEFTDDGNERLPVCRVGLSGNTGMKDLNRAILEFYSHLGRGSGTAAQFGHRALDCVVSCETKLLIIDEVHFLRWRSANATEVSNHFKYLANEFPVTLLLIGVGLEARGLFDEGRMSRRSVLAKNGRLDDGLATTGAVLAQTGRRTTRLTMEPFAIDDEAGRQRWRTMLLAIEERLVLAEKYPGMIADDLADYLYCRSSGHIGSLMTLIKRGCQRAVRTGEERLGVELLDQVKNDEASERARMELEAAMENGTITARTKSGRGTARRSTS
jgi:hypothetical protein